MFKLLLQVNIFTFAVKMRRIQSHMIFIMTVIGLLTYAGHVNLNSVDSHIFIAESEFEENFNEEYSPYQLLEDYSIDYFDDDGISKVFSYATPISHITRLEFRPKLLIKYTLSTVKVAFFILYCCLKIHC